MTKTNQLEQTTCKSEIRRLPYSLKSEQYVLGGLMLDRLAWNRVATVITAEDFYRPDHGQIFQAIQELAKENREEELIDKVLVSNWMEKRGLLEQVGGFSYLKKLVKRASRSTNIDNHAKVMKELSTRRQILQIGDKINEMMDAYYNHWDGYEILGKIEKLVLDAYQKNQDKNSMPSQLSEILEEEVHRISELSESKRSITGLSTGFKKLDKITSGLQSSDLIVVASRPAMGKTAFAMNVVEHVAINCETPALFFSMGVTKGELVSRMLGSLGKIDQKRIKTGQLKDEDWNRLTSAIKLLDESNIFIDETAAITPVDIRAKARKLKSTPEGHNLGLIVIDYLQLIQSAKQHDNRVEDISEISRSLKALAKELDLPIVLLSQLNGSLENRPNKRPLLSDLGEGSLEQDADLITFIYRDEVYNKESPDRGAAEIIIGKQRNGPIGDVRLTFLNEYTRFKNFSSVDGYE